MILATDEQLKKLPLAEPVIRALALALCARVRSDETLREMEQKTFLSFSDIHRTPACYKDFSDAELYFITGKRQQVPQGAGRRGHLSNIIKLGGGRGAWSARDGF